MAGTDFVAYEKLIDGALRAVVRETLSHVVAHGLSGPHHLYLTFKTGFTGVEMPENLRAQHPEEMTIVLQHQYWGLEVAEESFAVSLSFNRAPQRLVIPFAALTRFADPGVNFGLQFQGTAEASTEAAQPAGPSAETAKESKPSEPGEGKVITLDSFRRK